MDHIDEQHVSAPGLLVLDIAAADESTALAALRQLSECWASSGTHRVWRVPGEAGVRARLYADMRRPGTNEG
ncbi:hypothetical protein J7E91_32365 [Streptomyces sp. ISL-99]|uniref:DUF6207 family protein n=1 Tax=Streptomyces sp. ISL-99 TaxID=2819193 RepID=UPI001BE5BE16|nr:DUF6207 family protein [Streptomyces sp. ISL-99]MBT2529931.1 hypothetical protein [Streptomyces sp. ISL-99]